MAVVAVVALSADFARRTDSLDDSAAICLSAIDLTCFFWALFNPSAFARSATGAAANEVPEAASTSAMIEMTSAGETRRPVNLRIVFPLVSVTNSQSRGKGML
jgi:hypothetical protein